MTMIAETVDSYTAFGVHRQIQETLSGVSPEDEVRMGLQDPELRLLRVPGLERHRLYTVDESSQPSGSFKDNGMALAVKRDLHEHPERARYYCGTAGNAGASVAWAASSRGREAVLVAPRTLRDSKRENMKRRGGEVMVVESDLVVDAIAHAEQLAGRDPRGHFLHPFDNPDALAGQGLPARRVARKFQELGVTGDVIQMLQRGGGSLCAASASVGYTQGWQTYEVRPAGDIDSRYDGLNVAKPGKLAAAILGSDQFVAGTHYASPADTGRAAQVTYEAYGRDFEPSALAGVAAALRHAQANPRPTTYLTILSGRNAGPGAVTEFVDAALEEQELYGATLLPEVAAQSSDGRPTQLLVACGATALGNY